MLIQPAVTSFPWVTTRRGWGTDPLWSHSCQGRPAAQRRTRIVTFGSSQIGWASQTSFCCRKDPKRALPFPSGVFRGVLGPPTPADSLWATSIPWLCGSREKGGMRVAASSRMEPGPERPLCSPPHSSHSRCKRSRRVSPGPHTRPTRHEWPLVV